jgi:hypothetical protein
MLVDDLDELLQGGQAAEVFGVFDLFNLGIMFDHCDASFDARQEEGEEQERESCGHGG